MPPGLENLLMGAITQLVYVLQAATSNVPGLIAVLGICLYATRS